MTVPIRYLTPPEVEARQADIVAVYRAAFTPPPYDKPESQMLEFARSLGVHSGRAAFRFVGVCEADSPRLLGFAYGYASLPGQWWYEQVRPALPGSLAAKWMARSFQFAELAVRPEAQGQGLGGALHDALLRDLPFAWAVLSTLHLETPARRLYRRRGWVVLHEPHYFPDVARPYSILGLELPDPPG